MEYVTIETNGDIVLNPNNGTDVFQKDKTTFKFFSGLDGATVTVGCKDKNGDFSAYKDGLIIGDTVINHGRSAALMIRTENYSSAIEIGYTI